MFRLTIRDARGQRSLAVDRTEVLVGGREGADVELIDAQVGPNHCLLRVEGGSVRVLDLGSGAGVVSAGRRVRDALLAPGAVLQLGGALLRLDAFGAAALPRLELEAEPAAPPTPWKTGPAPSGTGDAPAPPAADASDFGRELRAMLAHAPWYGISLVTHVLALMVLHLLTLHAVRENDEVHLRAVASQDLPSAESMEADKLAPEFEELRPAPAPLEMEMQGARLDESADAPVVFDPNRVDAQPTVTGLQGPVSGRLTRPLRTPTLVQDAGTRLDRGNLDGEQKGARTAVERGLGNGLGHLRGLPPDRIVVLAGEFDHMEKVLVLYGIPHTVVTREQFRSQRYPHAVMLCINCDQLPPPLQRTALAQAVRRFVADGGWLITSDWAVDPYLLSGWPQHVTEVVAKKREQPDTVVGVRPQHTSPLLEGVFHPRARAEWWLENSSLMVEVNPKLVDVLIVSDDMKQRYGASAVAFTWRQDQGRVLHLLGHFYQKDGNRSGLVAMHRLTLNYLVERFEPR